MASRSGLKGLAGLLLFVSAAALLPPRYSLRNERPPSSCGFADYGSAVGTAQRLVETQLTPGVADWNIVVPMPPPCVGAPLTGVEMQVCDSDTPPDVTLSDMRSARVHRTGRLTGFAAVNVTVYCIIAPTTTLPPPPPLFTSRSDPTSTYELSNELTSNEETSDELKSVVSASTELATTVNPISTTTLPPVQEETTLPTEVVTHQPNSMTHPKENISPSLQVTINISPTNRISIEEDKQSYEKELPFTSNKEKPNEVKSSHSSRYSSEADIVTPPRISGMPPRKYVKHPRRPDSLQYQPPPRPGLPPYLLEPSYPLAPLYRPNSLFGSRLRLLQRQPLLFFRHY